MKTQKTIGGRKNRSRYNVEIYNATGLFASSLMFFAMVKYGGGITQMSGSIAGNTFARNRYGNYVRSRTKPVNPNSTGQGAVRDALSALSEYWNNELNAAQRIAWATYAASVSMKNRLGEAMYLTGFNHFIRSNTELLNHKGVFIEAGPTDLSLPAKDTLLAAAGSLATQLITVTFDAAQTWNTVTGGHMWLYMGQPRKGTRNFFAGPWKYMGVFDGNTGTPLTSPKTIAPPYTLVLGQLVTCYARIQTADGRMSEPFTCSFTVAA